jgi:hypothetical protein
MIFSFLRDASQIFMRRLFTGAARLSPVNCCPVLHWPGSRLGAWNNLCTGTTSQRGSTWVMKFWLFYLRNYLELFEKLQSTQPLQVVNLSEGSCPKHLEMNIIIPQIQTTG